MSLVLLHVSRVRTCYACTLLKPASYIPCSIIDLYPDKPELAKLFDGCFDTVYGFFFAKQRHEFRCSAGRCLLA